MQYPKVATGLPKLGTDPNRLFCQLPNANLNRWEKGEYISISITLASCALANGCSGSLLLETGMAAGCFSVDCDSGGGVSASWVMIISGHNTILTGHGGSLCLLFIGLLSLVVSGSTMSFPFCAPVWLCDWEDWLGIVTRQWAHAQNCLCVPVQIKIRELTCWSWMLLDLLPAGTPLGS